MEQGLWARDCGGGLGHIRLSGVYAVSLVSGAQFPVSLFS